MGSSKKSKRVRYIVVVVVLLLAGGGAFWWWKQSQRQGVVTVQTEKVTRRNLTELVVANGRIQPVVQVVIAPEVSGEIIELPVKEGQPVRKGDVLVRIKPDNYQASRRSAEANYQAALAGKSLAQANLNKAELEYKRSQQLFADKLISESQFLEARTVLDVAKASCESSGHQADQAKAALARVQDDLDKTTITAPMEGTVTRLRSQKGERVVGTALMAGTEIMTIADLGEMEARVDIGEMDVILIALRQKVRLEVDAFKDRKFTGVVTEIANAAKGLSASSFGSSSSVQQEATKFEVKIRVQEKEAFRPGMSVTAEIETRYRTNVLAVPIQSVTTRPPKKSDKGAEGGGKSGSNSAPASSVATVGKLGEPKKPGDAVKPIELVFVVEGEQVKAAPVKRGISDDAHVEIVEGLQEGQEVVSGGYKAINRELEEGKQIKRGEPVEQEDKDKDKQPG